MPASSEAKASLACEDRQLVGCVRASNSVAEVGERGRGSEKRDSPGKGGRVDGNQSSRCSQEHRGQQRHRQLAPWWQSHGAGVGPSRVSERASRGEGLRKMEGTLGRFLGRSFTRADRRRSWRLSRGPCARASRAVWERRQECQRQGMHAARREDNARHAERPRKAICESVQPAEANRTVVQQAISSTPRRASA